MEKGFVWEILTAFERERERAKITGFYREWLFQLFSVMSERLHHL